MVTARSFLSYMKQSASLFPLVVILSCDTFDGDRPRQPITFSQQEYYVLPASSIVIDLKSTIKQSFKTVSLSITQEPTRGTLVKIDKLLYRYTPDTNFGEGIDKFVLSAVLDSGTIVGRASMTINMKDSKDAFPCGVFGIEDFVRVVDGTAAKVVPASNDRVCEVSEPLRLFIKVSPEFGDALVVDDAIIYSPASVSPDGDELIYGQVTADGDTVAYGIVAFNKRRIQEWTIPMGYNDIFFVNDTVGFIAGSGSIQKTNDGGKRWHPVYAQDIVETDIAEFTDINELFFLNENLGFASYAICPFQSLSDYGCRGGWMKTIDGGESWSTVALDLLVNSIYFVSPLEGFISTAIRGPWDDDLHHSILKTTDEGKTWKVVYQSTTARGAIKMAFASDQVAYAYLLDDIVGTSDGGDTWTGAGTHDAMLALGVTQNIICASVADSPWQYPGAGAILRQQSGGDWSEVLSVPYAISALGFSPLGQLGIGVGTNSEFIYSDTYYPSVVLSVTLDEGQSWAMLPEQISGRPVSVSVPSENAAYILCDNKVIRYRPW